MRVSAHASNRAERPGAMAPTRPMGCASTALAMRWGCAFSRLMMKDPPMHWPYRWHRSMRRWSSRAMWSAA